jgi:stage V sporulation protein B
MMRTSFWRGAAWLTAGAFLSKGIGAVYRIFLPRVLGDTGVGLFQLAYPLYAVALAVSVSGVPIALSKQTAEYRSRGEDREADRLADWALVALALVGLVLTGVMEWAAWPLAAAVFHEPRAVWPLRALAPALFLVAIQAGLRGDFQGQQDMKPTAVSQILEQATRVAVMFPLALWLLPRGIAWGAAGATLGASAGALAGVGYLMARRRRPWALEGPVPWRGLAELARTVGPMAVAALLFPLLLLVDAVTVPTRLMAAGWSADRATAAYGRLAGEAMPLVNLALVAGTALAVSLVPAIATALAEGRVDAAQERVRRAFHAVWLVTLPMAGGLFVLAEPMCSLLYGEAGAAGPLRVLAFGTAFLALQQMLGNALQAAGFGWRPVVNLLAGAAAKWFLTWWLTPWWGVAGAAAGTGVAAALTAWLNWRVWCGRFGRPASNPWAEALAPLAATLGLVAAVHGYLAGLRPEPPTALFGVVVGALVYGGLALVLGEGRFVARIWRDR